MSPKKLIMLSDGARPTEDIYLLEPVAGHGLDHDLSVSRIEASRAVIMSWYQRHMLLKQYRGGTLVICRSLPVGWIRWLEHHRLAFSSIVYLIDDDIPAAVNDTTLPQAYRSRMKNVAEQQPRLLALANEVVVCSEQLAKQLMCQHEHVSVLTPPFIAKLPDLAHFRMPPSQSLPWQVGFYGTRSHLNDLMHIAPALNDLQHCGITQLVIMLGKYTPGDLAVLPNVLTPEPLDWNAFRRFQARERLHIGLAPLLPTRFNAGKSFIKFLDIAAMGGVGIYSNRYPYTEVVRHGENGLLVGDTPDEWQAALQQLLNNPEATANMAQQAAIDAVRVGDPQHAVDFWQARQR